MLRRLAKRIRCVHEFLGVIGYTVRGQPKVVQFWRMQAAAQPSREITKDIVAVDWLPLAAAARRLSFALGKLFLLGVGRRALKRRQSAYAPAPLAAAQAAPRHAGAYARAAAAATFAAIAP